MTTILNIGSSSSNIKSMNVNLENKSYEIDKNNWATNDTYDDTFSVTIKDDKCIIKRTDLNTGWSMNLSIYVNINNKHNLPELIDLTMTTRPERLSSYHFKKVYNSLLKQLLPFSRLMINLETNTFVYDIPTYLKQHKNVILNETNICGPCAKLVGSIDIIPDRRLVIVLDDDIVMRTNFIENLYYSYLKNPDKVCSNFTGMHTTQTKEILIEPMGFGGYIFRMNDKIRTLKQYYKTMPIVVRKIDDTWFGWVFLKLNIQVHGIYPYSSHIMNTVLDISNTDPHPAWIELCKDSNRQELITKFLKMI